MKTNHHLRLSALTAAALCLASVSLGAPTGYVPLEYIESTGTQWIDTKVVAQGANTSLEMDITATTTPTETAFFGYNYNGNQYLLILRNGNILFYGPGTTVAPYVASHDYRLSVTNGTVTVIDETTSTTNSKALKDTYAGTATLPIFANSGGGHMASFRLRRMKIWKNGALVRDFVPCYRIDAGDARTPGLYDEAGDYADPADGFFANKGKGNFLMGDLRGGRLQVSAAPMQCGSPEPGYGYTFNLTAGATLPVSCPAFWTNEMKTVVSTCTGWKLFDFDGNLVAGGAETAFEYVHPSPAAHRRLEWQFDVTFLAPAAGTAPNRFVGPAGGDWAAAPNWSYGRPPIHTDAVLLDEGVSVLCAGRIDVASLAITNATLAVKGADYGHVAVSVSGDLDLGPKARLTVTAGRAATPTDFAAMYDEIEDVVAVGGTLHIAEGAVFSPVADILTGLPVQVVAARFRLDEGGLVDAANQGYGYLATPSPVPAGAYASNGGYTFAKGHGINYDRGAAYGATASHNEAKAYGFAYAPWLPGSPNGMYNKFSSYPAGNNTSGWGRGGGAFFLRATDSAFLGGLVDCRGCYRFYGSSSGGGIWLVAPDFRLAPTAELCAEGGPNANNYGTRASGTGGRVSLAIGLTADQISNLATGKPPASLDLAYGSSPSFIRTSVLGGLCPPTPYYTTGSYSRQNAGTATWTLNASAAAQLTVSGVGAADANGIAGVAFVRVGQALSIGVEEFKTAAEARSHYVATGWSVTNAAGETVASGTGGTATFTPAAGPLFLTWEISAIEEEIDIALFGDGALSVNGVPAPHGATIRAARGSSLALAATPGAGSSLAFWRLGRKGEIGAAADAPVVREPAELAVLFSPAAPAAKTFSGASGGYWEDPANWSPAGVPTAADAVAIGADTAVLATSQVYAASLEIAAGGVLAVGGATANVAAQTKAAGASFGLTVAGDVALHGSLSLGGAQSTAPVFLAVGGDLALDGSAVLAVYASRASGFAFDTLYREATVAAVRGALTLAGTARVLPDAERVTGAPVRFRAGSVSVGADAAFDASLRGWGCTTFTGELPRNVRAFVTGTISSARSCSYAPGTGCDVNATLGQASSDAGHGGRGDTPATPSGRVYGYKYAPFLPGSNGRKSDAADRGGGTVWIECANHFMLDGALVADGGFSAASWSSSGGGVWVVTRGFSATDTARLSARGGGNAGVSGAYGSGGGRISIATGLTDAERDDLAAGRTPASLEYEDAITFVAADVSGGQGRALNAGENYKAGDGSLSTVRGTAGGVEVIVAGDPLPAVSAGAAYGSVAASVGQRISLSASAYGFDPDDADVRYACLGYLATNALGEVVAQGDGTAASFTVADEKTYFTWLWGDMRRPLRVDVADAAMGAVSYNGAAHTGSFTEWASGETTSRLVAAPAAGHEFLYWVGDVPAGLERGATLDLPAGVTRRVMAVFRPAAAPAARVWLGGNGAWLDPTMWQGGVIPGLADDVTISAGNCIATNYAETGSVTVSGTGRLLAGTWQGTPASVETARTSLSTVMRPFTGTAIEAARFVVSGRLALAGSGEFGLGGQNQPYWTELRAGSFTLDGAAKAMVTAGPLGGARTFATGSGFINVAETFTVGGQGKLFLVCDGYTGGPVVCRAERFSVGPEATVSANYYGFCFHISKSPQTCAGTGRGNSYDKGPAHGGYGGGWDTKNRSYGIPYDYPYGPVMPGACVSPPYNGTVGNSTPGSGVIRVHARHVRIEGTVTAEQPHKVIDTATGYGLYNNSIYSAGAGGTIWITSSGLLRVQPGALVTARGQRTGQSATNLGYGGGAAGGRISLGRGLADDEVAALVENGSAIPARETGKPIEAKNAAAFAEDYPGATVRVDANGGGGAGTFWFLDGGAVEPTLLILR